MQKSNTLKSYFQSANPIISRPPLAQANHNTQSQPEISKEKPSSANEKKTENINIGAPKKIPVQHQQENRTLLIPQAIN